jgi:signal transduction histidine kinase
LYETTCGWTGFSDVDRLWVALEPRRCARARVTGAIGPGLWLRRGRKPRTTLFRKYAGVLGALVVTALLVNGGVGTWLFYEEHRASLIARQEEQAGMAADSLGQFLRGLEDDIGWVVQLPWAGTSPEQRRLDALRLLGHAPAVAEVAVFDPSGHEWERVSRVSLDVLDGDRDLSWDPRFTQSRAKGHYYGPVYFRRESEPFLSLAVAGRRQDTGVAVAEINLKSIWDLTRRISDAARGIAYLVDGTGRLIAHPDISLVLGRSDFSGSAQVQAAFRQPSLPPGQTFTGLNGQRVVVASASVPRTDWKILVEVPVSEAFAPVNRSLWLSSLILLVTLAVSAVVGLALARRMVVPVRVLEAGAARIAAGDLSHRITLRTGDEIEDLAAGFNAMARHLERSYSDLEAKVQERTRELEASTRELQAKTRELEIASDHKSQFLAILSHELRTPLNAIIGLTEAMVDHSGRFGTGGALDPLRRVHRAGLHLLGLINQLLDLAKIEAGKLEVCRERTELLPLIADVAETVRPLAARNGNALAVEAGKDLGAAEVDPLRLRQILLNVVGNACKFTKDGTVVLSAHRTRDPEGGEAVDFVVSDTGIGMTVQELAIVFEEFSQASPATVRKFGGTGLGLSIARRLCQLMHGDLTATSEPDRGSRFVIHLPVQAPAS